MKNFLHETFMNIHFLISPQPWFDLYINSSCKSNEHSCASFHNSLPHQILMIFLSSNLTWFCILMALVKQMTVMIHAWLCCGMWLWNSWSLFPFSYWKVPQFAKPRWLNPLQIAVWKIVGIRVQVLVICTLLSIHAHQRKRKSLENLIPYYLFMFMKYQCRFCIPVTDSRPLLDM